MKRTYFIVAVVFLLTLFAVGATQAFYTMEEFIELNCESGSGGDEGSGAECQGGGGFSDDIIS